MKVYTLAQIKKEFKYYTRHKVVTRVKKKKFIVKKTPNIREHPV